MRAKSKGIVSADLPSGSPELPENPKNCWIVVEADIGIDNEDSSDIFTFYVTTPKFLQTNVKETDYRFGKGLLIVEKFDWALIETTIDKLASSVSGENWEEIANKLSRYGDWEFEDYKENK